MQLDGAPSARLTHFSPSSRTLSRSHTLAAQANPTMLFRTTFHALRCSKAPVKHVRCTSPPSLLLLPNPLKPPPWQPVVRAYSNGSPPSSMGTSRPGWFRTEQDRTRALWGAAILATVGGWWYMTREPVSERLLELDCEGDAVVVNEPGVSVRGFPRHFEEDFAR